MTSPTHIYLLVQIPQKEQLKTTVIGYPQAIPWNSPATMKPGMLIVDKETHCPRRANFYVNEKENFSGYIVVAAYRLVIR